MRQLSMMALVALCLVACRTKRDEPAVADAAPPAMVSPVVRQVAEKMDRERRMLRRFVDWAGEHRSAPHKIPNGAPECETRGPSAGQCEVAIRVDDDPIRYFTARYYKAEPSAARFSAHFTARLTCDGIGATVLSQWPEKPGLIGAGGSRCRYQSGVFEALKSLYALIELNKGPQGQPETGVHIFAEDYAARDASFYKALEAYEALGASAGSGPR
jgi:hypothetical protein